MAASQNTFLVGLICTALGAGLGLGVSHFALNNDGNTKTQATADQDTGADKAQSPSFDEGKYKQRIKSLQKRAEEAEAKVKKASSAKTNQEEDKAVNPLRAELDAAKVTIKELQSKILLDTPFDQWTDEQKAEVKAKAKALLERFNEAMEGGEKEPILKEINAIRDLGLGAKDEFLEAYNALGEVGNPWAGPEGNKLGLKMQEFNSVMHLDVADYVANLSGDDIPVGAQIHAAHIVGFDSNRSLARRARSFGNLLRNAKSPWTVGAVAMNLPYLEGEEIGDMLAEVLMDANVSIASRVQAGKSLGGSYISHISSEQIAQLKAENRDELNDVVNYLSNVKNPPATGYAIAYCDPGSQASVVGLKTGDLITVYDGVVISSVQVLLDVQEKSKSYEVEISLLRDGETKFIKVQGGKLGIHGNVVKAD